MGFECPVQQTTPDFLTSLTSASERTPRAGFENKVPRSPNEFTKAWKTSEEYGQLRKDISSFGQKYPFEGKHYEDFVQSRKWEKSKHRSVAFFDGANHQFDEITVYTFVRGADPALFEERILAVESRTNPHLDPALWKFDHVARHWFRILRSGYVFRSVPSIELMNR